MAKAYVEQGAVITQKYQSAGEVRVIALRRMTNSQAILEQSYPIQNRNIDWQRPNCEGIFGPRALGFLKRDELLRRFGR